jgi:hypothetical protein
MLKLYKFTPLFIIVVILGVQWGFYKPYTSQFPDFINKSYAIHIHGALWMTWLCLLVAQPLLIWKGRNELHRTIGKVSYVLGPALILFLFLAGKESYWKILKSATEHEALKFIVLDSRGLISFIIFWTLAMLKRKEPAAHMRYMIGTGILAIGPGFGRALVYTFDLDFGIVFTILDMANVVLVGMLLANDIRNKQNYRPFLVVLITFIVGAFLWQIRDSVIWQATAKSYASIFY